MEGRSLNICNFPAGRAPVCRSITNKLAWIVKPVLTRCQCLVNTVYGQVCFPLVFCSLDQSIFFLINPPFVPMAHHKKQIQNFHLHPGQRRVCRPLGLRNTSSFGQNLSERGLWPLAARKTLLQTGCEFSRALLSLGFITVHCTGIPQAHLRGGRWFFL